VLIGIPTETYPGEKRVAMTPETAVHVIKLGHKLCIQSGAGLAANIADALYAEAGVEVLPDAAAVYQTADIILKVRAPQLISNTGNEVELLTPGTTLLGFIWPAQNEELMNALASRKGSENGCSEFHG